MKRVAILISGGGSNMVALVNAMQGPDFGAIPVLVLANSADASGLEKAKNLGVSTTYIDHKPFKGDRQAFEKQLNLELEAANPDIICLAGFMRVLTPEFMQKWAGKILNIHPSLLPHFKGLNTHQRALDAGHTKAGCTVHIATADLDDGPILGQAEIPILPDDTAETLAARVLKEEHKLYPAALKAFVKSQ